MTKILEEYKGVILLLLVLVTMASILSHQVKKLNAMSNLNTVAYYEK